MKKFSKITNQSINEEPKVDSKIDEAQILKYKMIDLMNRFLNLRTYGSIDNRFLGTIKIEGKEMLAEALFDLFSDKSSHDKIKVLEGLRSKIGDWEVIDNEIEMFNNSKPTMRNKMKFKSILENWSSDADTLLLLIDSKINNISSIEDLNDFITLTKESQLSDELKFNILQKYSERINQLTK